jgi:hypothetical protein
MNIARNGKRSLFRAMLSFSLLLSGYGAARAQSGGFSVVLDYYNGCDPVAADEGSGSCKPVSNFTYYFEPGVGTASITKELRPKNQSSSTVIQRADGTSIRYFSEVDGYYSLKMPGSAGGRGAAGNSGCTSGNGVLLVRGRFMGLEVLRFQFADRPGEERIEWLAPALNCFVLRSEWHVQGGHTVYQVASSVSEGRQPSAVFSPPAGMPEISPLELHHKLFIARYMATRYLATRRNADPDAAEREWLSRGAKEPNLVRMESTWRKQHGLEPQ